MAVPATQPHILSASACSPRYLQSPISTLLKSWDDPTPDEISMHDIAQAYATVHDRLKVLARFGEGEACHTALETLTQNATRIGQCLLRDMARTLHNPIPRPQVHHGGHAPESLISSAPEHSDDDLQYAYDLSCVAQHALLLLALVARVPQFWSVFSEDMLRELFTSVSSLAREPTLPTPSAGRTRTLALWLLSSHTLPVAVITTQVSDLAQMLKGIIRRDTPEDVSEINIEDGLRILYTLVLKHSDSPRAPGLRFIPHVYFHVVSSTVRIRIAATRSLGGYAIARLSAGDDHRSTSCVREDSLSFIVTHAPSHRAHDAPARRLYDVAMDVMARDEPLEWSWLMSTLGYTMILGEGSVLVVQSFLRLVVNVASAAARSPRHSVRAMHTCLWRCLVWSLVLFRRYAECYQDDPERSIQDWKTRWFTGIEFLKQEIKDGLGAALLYCVLGSAPVHSDEDGSDSAMKVDDNPQVSPWIQVLAEMIRSPHPEAHREGVAVFSHLLGQIGSSADQSIAIENLEARRVLVPSFFDGTTLDASSLPGFAIPAFDIACIRRLTSTEVEVHWYDLMNLWEVCLERTLRSEKSCALLDDLVSIWHALLLVQSELTQRHGHLALPQESTKHVLSLILSLFILDDPSQGLVPTQIVKRLIVAKQLWDVFKNAFASEWLCEAAEEILIAIFKANLHSVDDNSVRVAWDAVCKELISAIGQHRLRPVLSSPPLLAMKAEIRSFWHALAKTWDSADYGWDLTVNFLAAPVGHWIFSQDEADVWATLIPRAIADAKILSVPSNTVLEAIIQRAFIDTKAQYLELLPIIISHIDLSSATPFPLSLFTFLNDVFCQVYHQEDSSCAMLDNFRALTSMLQSHATPRISEFVASMRNGVSIWMKDMSTIIPDDDYNDVMIPFYRACLEHLKNVPQSAQTLRAIGPFIYSAFEHMPAPGHGPRAFLEFWAVIRERYSLRKVDCPEHFKECLIALRNVLGGIVFGPKSDAEDDDDDGDDWIVPDSQPGTPPVEHLVDFPDDFGMEDRYGIATRPPRLFARSSPSPLRESSPERNFVDRGSSPIPELNLIPSSSLPPSSERDTSPFVPETSDPAEGPSSSIVARMLFKRARDEAPERRHDDAEKGSSSLSDHDHEDTFHHRLSKRARTSSPANDDEDVTFHARDQRHSHFYVKREASAASLSQEHPTHEDTDIEEEYAMWERVFSSSQIRVELEDGMDGNETEGHVSDVLGAEDLSRAADRSQSAPIAGTSRPGASSKTRALTTPSLPRSSSAGVQALRDACQRMQDGDMAEADLQDAQRLLREASLALDRRLKQRTELEPRE